LRRHSGGSPRPVSGSRRTWSPRRCCTGAGPAKHQPVARPISRIDGRELQIQWGPNWEDDLAGAPGTVHQDPNLAGPGGVPSAETSLQESVKAEYEQVFMMYLPRICEHCLNPACVASCPSGAMYKRDEDGIVLVDQDTCRGWRMCVSNCPYKKVYFNWKTGKAEKCTLCYPRIEAGLPTVCSETCVGRIRYLGLVLYDADRVEQAASTSDPHELLDAQLDVFLDPNDPEVISAAARDGIPHDWIGAAQRSPVWALAMKYRIALPLHPEYRTLPMVWYVPPLSPMTATVEGQGAHADPDDVFPAIDSLRIPVQYLANLLAAGDERVIRRVLKQLAAMRSYMRAQTVGGVRDEALAEAVGMTGGEIEDMYRLLAIARYEDRFVVPPAHRELAEQLSAQQQGACGLDFDGGPGPCLPEANDAASNGTAANGATASTRTLTPPSREVPFSGSLPVAHVNGNGNARLEALRARRARERAERRRTKDTRR
jgi:nitrate reductase / nitrite oxidoreductase, beta subunit